MVKNAANQKTLLLALYPSNKLEHLSYLLCALLDQQPGEALQPDTVLVESPGMQHYLNMSLARQKGIAMNLQFPLPVRFMWEMARTLLGDDTVPRQSPYRREVLIWRIDALLAGDAFCRSPEAAVVCRFWQNHADPNEQALQRLQLAGALADLFEQYLLYRPDWLFAWEDGETADTGSPHESWQAALWRMLAKEVPLHPARLHKQALNALRSGAHVPALPSRIIVFGINTMAPQLVDFFDALAAHTDIHIFHLNPSVNYWGDIASDKERARQLRRGTAEDDEIANPLLANLGQQGRDLFNLLTNLNSFEVSAFDAPAVQENAFSQSLLTRVQQDIYNSQMPPPASPEAEVDNSIRVVSTHNALREVQVLHDTLLDLFDRRPDLSPSDVVVMCPAIEEYAPFIDTVFHRIGTPAQPDAVPPRIPCSIADRSPLDAEPLIAAFVSLLSLPDSRFELSQILDYLRLDAVQQKFGYQGESLRQMQFWLEQAHIHWGLNAQHKARVTDNATSLAVYSWEWGLKRLLLGMACEDSAVVVDDVYTVPHVEGQNTVVLGKLIELVSLLGRFTAEMSQSRTAAQWHRFLMQLRDACFAPTQQNADAWESLARTTADLAAQCEEAGYTDVLTLTQVRDILLKRFSSPDAGNHFMTGQVTFCSMLPMRSIPFQYVCILGLNDGDFPRQSVTSSLDIMAGAGRRRGDRSRRLEDRYLFLEALLSARSGLYLSYQGRSAHDNSERQPSLVLGELLDVLKQGYGFTEAHYVLAPLHPFSAANFSPASPGFEAGWKRLAEVIRQADPAPTLALTPLESTIATTDWWVGEIARVFASPLKAFANHRLRLYLESREQPASDTEPFAENPLLRYQAIDAVTDALMCHADASVALKRFELSGDIPATPLKDTLVSSWLSAGQALNDAIGLHDSAPAELHWLGEHVRLSASAWHCGDTLKMKHSGAQSPRRLLEQFLTLLIANSAGNAMPLQSYYLKWEKGEASVRCAHFAALAPDEASDLLLQFENTLLDIFASPAPVFANAGITLLKAAKDEDFADFAASDAAMEKWAELEAGNRGMANGLLDDPYYRWFYPQGLNRESVPFTVLHQLYAPLLTSHKDKKV